MTITHLVNRTAADTVCTLLGIPHISYSKEEVSHNEDKYFMARGSWIEHNEDSMKCVSSYIHPGDRITVFPFFLAVAEAYGSSLLPGVAHSPQKIIAIAMCVAMYAEKKGDLAVWNSCMSSLLSCGPVGGIPSDIVHSFFVQNKDWLQIQFNKANLRTTSSRLLRRFDREDF